MNKLPNPNQLTFDIDRAMLPPYDPDVLYLSVSEEEAFDAALDMFPTAAHAFRRQFGSESVPTIAVNDGDPRLAEQDQKWAEEAAHKAARARERGRKALQAQARSIPYSVTPRRGPRNWSQRLKY